MEFTQTTEGKSAFISINSRSYESNPLYKAWKTKSFTDGDITLHFIVFDILCVPEISLTLSEIIEKVDDYISQAGGFLHFDESTIRKKLKEYTDLGIIITKKAGRKVTYSRSENTDIFSLTDILRFYSEVAPLGVIGSFLLDKLPKEENIYCFKHHYITETIDSEVLSYILDAISKKSYITVDNVSKKDEKSVNIQLIPLKIFISTQSGRQNLIAYSPLWKRLSSFRVDRLSNVKIGEICEDFDFYRQVLDEAEKYTWGVNCSYYYRETEKVEFHIKVNDDEGYIANRLYRERRCGKVIYIGDNTYKFTAEVYDTSEMIPWIRTFISRIVYLKLSNRQLESRFTNDLNRMYEMYGIGGDRV